ncbi:MAG: SDR family oxidoreductase [Sneathiella sp.]|nr:SDR family oxidoreductase [Sneathiella sp.]
MMSLENKIAVVTGAAGVLGEAVVRRFIAQGIKVVMSDINSSHLSELHSELGDATMPLAFDISDDIAVSKACEKIRENWGAPDILVNNAGILTNNKVAETSVEEWRRVMSINLDGAFYMSRELLPAMKAKKWGRIVNICSLAAKTGGITAGTAYTTSKGGMTALTFSLAREAAADGVTVNGISPAYINTPMVTEQLTEVQRQELLNSIPVKRFCESDEVAHVVSFLTSPMSGFITGEVIDINGGLHLD